jgi:hypothetical protein
MSIDDEKLARRYKSKKEEARMKKLIERIEHEKKNAERLFHIMNRSEYAEKDNI